METPAKAKTNKTLIFPKSEVTTTPSPVYVTIETPYVSKELTSSPTVGSRVIPTVSPIKEDYVIIYSIKNQQFSYNETAISYNLKNPPMLIDFALTVPKSTRTIEGDSRILANEWTQIRPGYEDPESYFEVTVREKSTGNIILKDGFGQSKQYGLENPRHLKIMSAGNFLIEMAGNKVAASVNLSVKRTGNIDNTTA
jgi:hypothetical protein